MLHCESLRGIFKKGFINKSTINAKGGVVNILDPRHPTLKAAVVPEL